jgi:hypothetical protein
MYQRIVRIKGLSVLATALSAVLVAATGFHVAVEAPAPSPTSAAADSAEVPSNDTSGETARLASELESPVPDESATPASGFCSSNPPACPATDPCQNPTQCVPSTSGCTRVDTGNQCCNDGGSTFKCSPGKTIHTVTCPCVSLGGPCLLGDTSTVLACF